MIKLSQCRLHLKHRGDQDFIVAGEPSVLRVTGSGHLRPKEASKSLPAFLKVIRRYASFRVALGWRQVPLSLFIVHIM
jgi:hypothetical protein